MIVAIAMVRDEADIIDYTARRMLAQVDGLIIADNLSTDGTRDIIEALPNTTVVTDAEVGFFQADKMTRLAHYAGNYGATWIVPFDADEAWTLPNFADIAADIVTASPYVYVPQDDEPNPLLWPWRQPHPEAFKKVCFRYDPAAYIHMGNHGVDRPGTTVEAAKVRHYQYRSLEQLRRKARQGTAACAATDFPPTRCEHWRQLAALTDEALAAWWESYVSQPLVHDA